MSEAQVPQGGDARSSVLTLRGITKTFGRARALTGIDLDLGAGEFVGLMGPNGAGKSTLIKILDGIHTADRGEIVFNGTKVPSLRGRREAGFVHQDLALVDALSIVENLRLGQEKVTRFGVLVDHGAERLLAERALVRVGLDRDVDTLISDLSPGEKALVAVARALDRGATFIIVDEATSTLAPADSRRVIQSLRKVTADGATVVMVSHKLNEILGVADRIVMLLDGAVSVDRRRADLDRENVLAMLYSHERPEVAGDTVEIGASVLQAQAARGDRCGPIDLDLHAGEVIGLTGLPGSGLHEVAMVLAGAARLRGGTVTIDPHAVRALVPPHRESQGGFPDLDVLNNLTVSSLRTWREKWGLVRGSREERDGATMLTRLDVRPPDPGGRFAALSGGNKQKVIFGRAMLRHADIYVLCEPTRGVDVRTRAQLYDLIRSFAVQGAGVLIVSSDAEDLFAVCDTVGVIDNGRIRQLRHRTELTPTMIEEMV